MGQGSPRQVSPSASEKSSSIERSRVQVDAGRSLRPEPCSVPEVEEVSRFLAAQIPRLNYTSKEPTFKDCFVARESWASVTKRKSIQSRLCTRESKKAKKAREEHKETNVNATLPCSLEIDSSSRNWAFFSLFFKKVALLNAQSSLLYSAKGGYFLNSLVSILLMAATSVQAVERFATTYAYVDISEYGDIGEALTQTLARLIMDTVHSFGDGENSARTAQMLTAWNRIYSRFLRSLSGFVFGSGVIWSVEVPAYLQRLVLLRKHPPAPYAPQFTRHIRVSKYPPTSPRSPCPTRTASTETATTDTTETAATVDIGTTATATSQDPSMVATTPSFTFFSSSAKASAFIRTLSWISSDRRVVDNKARRRCSVYVEGPTPVQAPITPIGAHTWRAHLLHLKSRGQY